MIDNLNLCFTSLGLESLIDNKLFYIFNVYFNILGRFLS